jgi:quercetin dioxygenase-like cupin family protein
LSKKSSVVIAGAVVVGASAAVALGSAGIGFTPTTLVTGNLPTSVEASGDGVKLRTKGPTDVRVQQIVIAKGGTSGWHHHPGVVVAAVASGTVTFTTACGATTYGQGLAAGSVFVESGTTPGQASSADGATVYATFIAPHVNPPTFRIEDTGPGTCSSHRDEGNNGGDNGGNNGGDNHGKGDNGGDNHGKGGGNHH